MKVLVTGADGFLAGYVITRLLSNGLSVIGLDDNSKYGLRTRLEAPGYQHVTGSASDPDLIRELVNDVDYVIANAAAVGGVEYLSAHDGEIGLTNSIATAQTLSAAINSYRGSGRLKRYVAISSSMVFDQTDQWPTVEGLELTIAPPRLSYGLEKRAMESYVRAAGTQFGLPYTIIRPFNCVGIGETRAVAGSPRRSGDVSLVMSHLVPDLIHKVLLGQAPLHILGTGHQRRHFTAAADIADGIVTAMLSPAGAFEDFNLATDKSHSVQEVAQLIWDRMNPGTPLELISEPSLFGDVEQRAPSTLKTAHLLGFRAKTSLEAVLDGVIPWVRTAFEGGRL